MHLRFKSFSATWLVCLSFPIISLQMWTAHGQMRSPSWHMCQCIINILPKWRQKKQEEDVLQRCKTFKDFMILIKSIPYDSYSISCAWVLFLKQQWSFKPLTRDIVRGEKINHWRLGTEWEQVLLLVNQLSVVLFKWVEICYFRPFWTGRQNQNCPNKIKGQILLWQILVSSVASAWKISKPQQLALPLVPEPQLIFPQLISNLPLDRETHILQPC